MNTQQSEIDILKAKIKTLDVALAKQSRTFNRMFYGFGCLFMAGIALAATSMQGVPNVIQAKAFQVVDDEGKVMAALVEGATNGVLTIFNKDGKIVARMDANAAGGLFGINSKDGKRVAGLSAQPDGGLLGINNKDGEIVVGLGSDPDGGGALDIYGKDEAITFKAP